MKRIALLAFAALVATSCTTYKQIKTHNYSKNPYERPLFYTRYLNPNNPLDAWIQRDINALRANPKNAPLHNELGQLLAQKGFPKDAETEFERSVNDDKNFWPAWYNLGLTRAARGDYVGARFAYGRTIHYKPGHAQALFNLGLLEEERGHDQEAVDYYAKAISINHTLLDVKTNPRVVDSSLMHLALLRAYPKTHTREAIAFQGPPSNYGASAVPAVAPATPTQAPSPQAPPEKILTPAPPIPSPARP